MTNNLDYVERRLSRRTALIAGAGILAGCTSDNNQQEQPPEQNNSSPENDSDPTNGTEPGNETNQTEEDKENKEVSRVTLEDVYEDSIERNDVKEPLISRFLEKGFRADTLKQFKVVDDALDLAHYANGEEDWKRAARHFRGAFTRQLEVGIDEARTGVMRTGGNGSFLIHKFKDEVDGEEIVRKMTGFLPNDEFQTLYIPWQDSKEFGEGAFETGLRRVWQEEDLTLGSAMEIKGYRVGVYRGETFEEYVLENENPGTWLSASRALDGQNDFIVYDPEWKERAEWGEIGYSRQASNVIHNFMNLFENQDFTPEWEMEETLTEMYHNQAKGNSDTFIHVGVTESGLEDDQTKLTEVDGQILYGETCGFEQHKKDAYEIAIPQQFWEDGERYPGDVELPDEYEDDNRPDMVDPEVTPSGI